jgi:hypothetical protein
MSKERDNERLLADILAEGSLTGQREASLAGTLRLVRRRRRICQATRGACILALIAVVGLVLSRRGPTLNTLPNTAKPYVLIETQPVRAMAIVESRSLPAANLISSLPTTVIVSTVASAGHARELNDQDLLELTAANPAVLVRQGSGSAQLVFVNAISQ